MNHGDANRFMIRVPASLDSCARAGTVALLRRRRHGGQTEGRSNHMHRVTQAVCVFSALLVGCTHSANDAGGSSVAPATQPAAAAGGCTPSPTIPSPAPENTQSRAPGPDP